MIDENRINTKMVYLFFILLISYYGCTTDEKSVEFEETLNYCDTIFSRQHTLGSTFLTDSVKLELKKHIELLQSFQSDAPVELSNCLLILANDFSNRGEFDLSNQILFQMESILNQEHLQDTCFMLAEAYSMLGYNYMQTFQLEKTALYSEKAKAVYENTNAWKQVITENARQALVHNGLGAVDDGIEVAKEALLLCDSLGISGTLECLDAQNSLGGAYMVKGESYLSEGRRLLAIQNFEEAARIYRSIIDQLEKQDPVPLEIYIVYSNLGLIYNFLSYKDVKYLDDAKDYLERGESVLKQIPGGHLLEPQLIVVQCYLSAVYAKRGDFDAAFEMNNKAVSLLEYESKNAEREPWLRLKNKTNEYLITTALAIRGQIYQYQYQSTQKIAYLESGLSILTEAIKMIEYFVQNEVSDNAMITQRAKMEAAFSGAIEIASLLYNRTKEMKYFEKAFKIAEQHKAYSLRQGIYQKMNEIEAKGPIQHLVKRDVEFTKQAGYLKKKLQKTANEKEKNVIVDSLLDLKNRKDQFLLNLQNSTEPLEKKYYLDRFNTNIPPFSTIKEEFVNKGTAFIEYHLGGHQPVAFVVTESDQHIIELMIPDSFYEKLTYITDTVLINDVKIKKYAKKAFDIYQALLGKIIPLLPSKVNRLIIVGDNQVRELPFEVLVTQEDIIDINETPYLLNDYSISYLYSAATYVLLNRLHSKNPDREGNTIAAFIASTPAESTESELMCSPFELRKLKSSADTILALFPNNTTRLEPRADKIQFINNAPNYNILHLVMHGCTDVPNSFDYYLQFYPTKSSNRSKLSSGLTVNEIYDLKLNAQLVVLASCNTEKGQLTKGEGTASIARAFTIAGCKNLVTSLNLINDQASARIYNYFYEELIKNGVTTSEALAMAKRRYLNDPEVKMSDKIPRRWANIILVGKSQSISIK